MSAQTDERGAQGADVEAAAAKVPSTDTEQPDTEQPATDDAAAAAAAGDDDGEGGEPDSGMETPEPTHVVRFESNSGTGVLTIDPRQDHWSPAQRTGLKAIGIETEGDDAVPFSFVWQFLHTCQVRELDPWLREAYLITHGNRWRNNRGEWVDSRKFTLVVGIDGFRKRGEEAGGYAGQVGPQWAGDDGVWREFWNTKAWGAPVVARVGIMRAGFDVPVYGVAMYEEFVPMVDEYQGSGRNRVKTGEKVPTPMWQKMPANQLAKCAEAQAWRKAFPRRFSGMYAAEEMERAQAEYQESERDRRLAESTRRRQEAYAQSQEPAALSAEASNPPAVVPGVVVEDPPKRDSREPAPVGASVAQAVDQVRERAEAQAERAPDDGGGERVSAPERSAPSEGERAQWLRDEVGMLAAVYNQTLDQMYTRPERALSKGRDKFTADDLWRMVSWLRKGGPAALRRAGRADEAVAYEQAVRAEVVAPLPVLLGHDDDDADDDPPAEASTSVDPHKPHAFIDNEGVCGVEGCERFAEDVIHEV